MGRLGLGKRPTRLPELQACAAIARTILMETWQRAFAPQIHCRQVLLTREDVRGASATWPYTTRWTRLLALAYPHHHENDTVSTDEIKFRDNDILSALVASLSRPTCW
jgi:glutamate 5-kinase